MNYLSSFSLVWIGMLLIVACQGEKDFSLPYEKFVLDNGLQVVLHEDKSDPIVSVAIQYHVGSAREKPGKTGFAHLFEHMLFQRSEHLGRNEFFKKIGELGGSFNGATDPTGRFIMRLYLVMRWRKCCGWSPTGWDFSLIR